MPNRPSSGWKIDLFDNAHWNGLVRIACTGDTLVPTGCFEIRLTGATGQLVIMTIQTCARDSCIISTLSTQPNALFDTRAAVTLSSRCDSFR